MGDMGVAILAGGRSSRMGSNKALLGLSHAGPTVIEMVVARLAAAGLHEPLLVTNSPEEYSFLGLQSVPDDIEGAGALGGILTALNHSRQSRTFIVACDMPLLNAELIAFMLTLPADYDALVPKWDDNGQVRVETLHAIYSVRCADVIRKQISLGRLKVSDFLDHVNVRYVGEEIKLHDSLLQSFYNVNTSQEWAKLVNLHSKE